MGIALCFLGFFCASNWHTMSGNVTFLLSWRAGFFSPPSCRQAQHTDLFGAGDVCMHMFCFSLFFFLERTMLWQPTANPKFGIPDIAMRKQTFPHLKWVTGQVWPQQPSELVWPCKQTSWADWQLFTAALELSWPCLSGDSPGRQQTCPGILSLKLKMFAQVLGGELI